MSFKIEDRWINLLYFPFKKNSVKPIYSLIRIYSNIKKDFRFRCGIKFFSPSN